MTIAMQSRRQFWPETSFERRAPAIAQAVCTLGCIVAAVALRNAALSAGLFLAATCAFVAAVYCRKR